MQTERPGHATELVRWLRGALDAVYVFSGDGGFNEVAERPARAGPVGFVPGGGTSVLPRALGLPRDPVAAAQRSLLGGTHPADLARERQRPALCLQRRASGSTPSSCGGSTRSAGTRRAARRRRRVRSTPPGLAERRAAAGAGARDRGHGRAAFALVANCDPYTYAAGSRCASPPSAFRARPRPGWPPARAPAMLRGFLTYACARPRPGARPRLYIHDPDRIRIVCDRPVPLQADGEDLGDVTEVLFEAERDAAAVLRLTCAQQSDLDYSAPDY